MTGWVCRIDAKVAAKVAQISKMELSARVKEDLKTVALGTSKINYLDPRITVAWCGPLIECAEISEYPRIYNKLAFWLASTE